MVGVCCGCIAKPASVQPRKTYNVLNAQLFAGSAIRTDEALDSTLLRRIQKLQEYVQVNPAKIPKVSRRLMRRIKATLQQPGDNLGYVKVAVYTYIYLLAHAVDDTSSYSPSFFAREIVSGPDAVVPLLLKDMHIEMRTLGAELLAVFTKVQSQIDNQLDAIQEHIPQVCRAAQAALNADRKEQKLQETAERRRAGEKLAVPNPLDLVARKNPAHVAALEVACLRCLVEVVALCVTSKVLPKHLTAVQAVSLDYTRQSSQGAVPGSTSSAPAAAGGSLDGAAAGVVDSHLGILDLAFYRAIAIHKAVPQGWEPRQLAGRLLQLLGEFTKDIATAQKVMSSFYEYMDDQHRWQEQRTVQELLQALDSTISCHQFPIYASLLRHATSCRLSAPDASVIVKLAADKGAALDEHYSLAALTLALTHLPRVWFLHTQRAPKATRVQAFSDFLRIGSLHGAKEAPMSGSKAAATLTATTGSSTMTIRPATQSVAANGLVTVPVAVGQRSARQVVHVTEQHSDVEVLQQQIAHLGQEVQSAVNLLAQRVGTAAELCEVLAGVLAAVAAELGLVPAAVNDGNTAQTVDTASVQARQPVGVANDKNRLSLDAGVRVSHGHPDGCVNEARVGVAAMMLQCAAAATDAFVQQCNRSNGSTATDAHLLAAPNHWLVLPGGVLPSNLITSALPLLKAGSDHIKWPVQQLLLALLPAAHKGIGSDKQSAELAEAVLAEVRHWDNQSAVGGSLDAVVATDQILRCCLKSTKPRPAVALIIGRALLHLHRKWSAEGFRGVGGRHASVAHAILLLENSQLAALAGALELPSLLAQQLPLAPDSCPAVRLTTQGLTATGAAVDVAASEAALSALGQQAIQHSRGLEATLLQAPALVSEYGAQLQQLLEQDLTLTGSTAVTDREGRAKQGQVALNAMLGKRMSSLRRDLLHVGELMHDSISRRQEPQPAHSLSGPAASIHAEGNPGRLARHLNAGNHAASGLLNNINANRRGSSSHSIEVEGGTSTGAASAVLSAAAEHELEQQRAALQGTYPAVAGADATQQQQPYVIDTDDISLQDLKVSTSRSTLSGQVAEVLGQSAAAGTFVVHDVKISKVAGSLEPVTV